jgi:ribosome recycling factor
MNRVETKERKMKSDLYENRKNLRSFVIDDGDIPTNSEFSIDRNSIVQETNYYMEKIATETYARFNRIFTRIPSIDVLQCLRIHENATLDDIATISSIPGDQISIHLNSKSSVPSVLQALKHLDSNWQISSIESTITVSPQSNSPSMRSNKILQTSKIGQWARNSILERRTNLIKKTKIEIRDISE